MNDSIKNISTSEIDWHFSIDGKRFGPYPEERIVQLIERKRITERSLVWNQSMPEWENVLSSKFADLIRDPKYNLTEMSTKSYPKRTEKNVMDSDGTVILTHGKLTGGSLLTRNKALQHDKPVLCLDMSEVDINKAVGLLTAFIDENGVEVLNVAGSRASKDSEIYGKTFEVVGGSVV